jgi:hypothetical protein
MANQENTVLTTYTIMDQGFEEGKLMYVAGKEDAEKGDLGTIVLPKPALDVQIDPQLPDPVVFSYSNTANNVIGLREVLVKIDSDADPLRPSTCTVSVLVPEVDDNWVSKCEDVSLVLDSATGPTALRNPHGLAQYGNWLYFIDYESKLIVTVAKSSLEGAGDNTSLPVTSYINLETVAGLPYDAKGQAIIALGEKIYALYIRTDPEATTHEAGVLLRLDINTSTGALSYGSGTGINNKTTVGLNPQSIIPVNDGTNVQLLIPAIGGRQQYNGTTNGTASNICVVQANLAPWPFAATPIVTGDPMPAPPEESKAAPQPPAAITYDIHAIGAAMRNGSSAMFILTQVYTTNAKVAFWMLYQTTVGQFLGITGTPTLSAASGTGGALDLLDQGLIQTPDPLVSDDIYFWDILYEQTTDLSNDDKDRLWLVLGSPFLITKAADYGSSSTPDANPFVMFSSFGGINVNSVDLTIETLHQAQREVSLKRGVRASKLGAAAVKAARATTSMSAEEGEDDSDK